MPRDVAGFMAGALLIVGGHWYHSAAAMVIGAAVVLGFCVYDIWWKHGDD